MKKFWVRTVNLILIVGIIVGYNQIILYRQKTEEVNRFKNNVKKCRKQIDICR